MHPQFSQLSSAYCRTKPAKRALIIEITQQIKVRKVAELYRLDSQYAEVLQFGFSV